VILIFENDILTPNFDSLLTPITSQWRWIYEKQYSIFF